MDSRFQLILATTGRATTESSNLRRISTQKLQKRLVIKLIKYIDLTFLYEDVFQEMIKSIILYDNNEEFQFFPCFNLFYVCWSYSGPLTNEAVCSINNFVNQREALLETSVEDLEKSLLLYLCWTKLKNFCPLTGRLKKEEILFQSDSFLDRFEVLYHSV